MGVDMLDNNNKVNPDGYIQGATTEGMYLSKWPTTITCPNCHQTCKTKVTKVESKQARDLSIACCFTGMFCCAFLPCFENNTEDTEHRCSNCDHLIGTACSDDILAG